MRRINLLVSLLSLAVGLAAAPFDPTSFLQQLLEEGLEVNLRNPEYKEDSLTTTEGGVIVGPNLRIQARTFTLNFEEEEGKRRVVLLAEGDLLVRFGEFTFAGERILYDFKENTGVIEQGITEWEPWFFKATKIELLADGTFVFHEGAVTASQTSDTEWELVANEILLVDQRYITANNLYFKVLKVPVFWLPRFRTDLQFLQDNPIRYRVRWGGEQGLRTGFLYECLSWNNFKAFLRFDYRFNRGPGGGFETEYATPNGLVQCYTKNYIARDSSIEEPNERTRYRFQGVYHNRSFNNGLEVDLTYDKLSDKEMASDYPDNDLTLSTGRRTQLHVRKTDPFAITNFITRVDINPFETVKQELPSIATNFYPLFLSKTGVVIESPVKVGYLDFQYSDQLADVQDYHSGRFSWMPRAYRPFLMGPLTVTPSVGGVGILYTNTPENDFRGVAQGAFECEANTRVSRLFGPVKHTIEPYGLYRYYTRPVTNPNQHYIFDIQDGWYSLNMMRTGVRNMFYTFGDSPRRLFSADAYLNWFFEQGSTQALIPKIYTTFVWDTFAWLRQTLDTAYDWRHGVLDHLNYRMECTVNADVAFWAEYRQRSQYAWRKTDYDNFFVDMFRTEQQLIDSSLSDKRETFLTHLFCRFHPNWALEVELRHGWNRQNAPNYTEYEIDLVTAIRAIWRCRFSYQKQEDDHRFAIYFNLGLDKPNLCGK